LQLRRFLDDVVDYPLHSVDYPIETNMTKYSRRTERVTLVRNYKTVVIDQVQSFLDFVFEMYQNMPAIVQGEVGTNDDSASVFALTEF
jgi:hypothetical protein